MPDARCFPSFTKKFESLLSFFLFSGKPERLKLEELFNSPDRGGLGLMDIRNKADSLFINQLTRIEDSDFNTGRKKTV